MRKMGDLMKDLGFREDASEEVKEAFVKNLLKSAYGIDLGSSKTHKQSKKLKTPQSPTQLAFDFGDETVQVPNRHRRKSS